MASTSLESPPSARSTATADYRVGTLVYSRIGLVGMCFWMLVGAFCLQLMEQLPSSLVPLQLRWAQVSDALIGFLSGSLPAFLGMLLNPFVGVQSDRHRSKMGRRRPFLLWSTPVVVASLLGLGFTDPVAAFLSNLTGAASVASVKVGWIGGCMVVFVIANTYIMQVYQFLFVDVIPASVMGRFVGCYRAVGALGTFAFHRFLFGKAETHTSLIYIVSALLYAVSFMLMVWNVKEGSYPPPPPKQSGGIWEAGKTYFKESFGHSFYWKTYSLSFFFWGALVPLWTFMVFFATSPGGGMTGYADTLGLSLDSFGKIRGWSSLVSVPVFFAVGPFIDRFHPLRICIVGLLLCVLTFAGCFFFAHNETTFLIWLIAVMAAQAVYMGAYLTLLPRLFLRSKYGQFVSANQIFGFCGVGIAPVLCGWWIASAHDYRYVFAWCGVCTALSLLMSVLLYRHWKQLGGDHAYTPPGVSELN